MSAATVTAADRTAVTSDYWRGYHDATALRRADALRESYGVESTGVCLNVDVYAQPDRQAPVLIFNHGGGGYSRLFIPLALVLYDRGYTVVLPDQRGQGFSEGDRGDFLVPQLVQNLVDVAQWARQRFEGPLFMSGGSIGGSLTYMAAAEGAPVKAIICHNLYDLGSANDALGLSRFAPLTRIPGFTALSRLSIGLVAALLPRLRVPFRLLGRFDKMVDEPPGRGFFDRWQADPLPIRRVTLRYMRSTFTASPAVPFEQNRLPVLVINPVRDRMTAPALTRRNYERLGGPKHYVELPFGHFAFGEDFEKQWVDAVDTFVQQHID